MEINGKVAIVTGGSSGIGAASVRLLAARGMKVLVADINEEKGNAIAKEVGGAFAKVDVTSTDQITDAIDMARSMGEVWALVNSAGWQGTDWS